MSKKVHEKVQPEVVTAPQTPKTPRKRTVRCQFIDDDGERCEKTATGKGHFRKIQYNDKQSDVCPPHYDVIYNASLVDIEEEVEDAVEEEAEEEQDAEEEAEEEEDEFGVPALKALDDILKMEEELEKKKKELELEKKKKELAKKAPEKKKPQKKKDMKRKPKDDDDVFAQEREEHDRARLLKKRKELMEAKLKQKLKRK